LESYDAGALIDQRESERQEMTETTRKALTNELEATTRSLQQQIANLRQNLTSLEQMVNSSEESWDQYQFSVWTEGAAARCVTEIASLLARQQTLQEALHLLNKAQEEP